jgi:DNA-binding transcriptional LysR family regulator
VDFSQFEALLAVVDTGTFTRAADQLALTQSALTRRIQALEVEFGCPLLVRARPRAELTATGQEVVGAARRIATEIDQLRELTSMPATEPRRPLRAAATAIGISYIYWRTCERFLEAHPMVDLVFQDVASPADAPRLVKAGGADVAFTALPLPVDVRGLDVIALGNVETVLVASPRHPLAEVQSISRQRLRASPMLAYRHRGDTSHFVNQSLFKQLGGRPTTLLETSDTEYIKRVVMLGRWFTALPWPAVEQEVRAGQLVLLDASVPRLFQDVGVAVPTSRLGRPARILVDFCRSLDFVLLRRP